jgi:hypothetical protein
METYGELKTTVADWLDREDLVAQIPDFIRLTEAEIYRDLRCQDNEFKVTYDNAGWTIEGRPTEVVYDGVFKILPPNYREMKLVTWAGRALECVSLQRLQGFLEQQFGGLTYYYAMSNRQVQFYNILNDDATTWGDGVQLVYNYYGTESLDSYPIWQVETNPVEDPPIEDNNPLYIDQSDANTTRMFQRNPDVYLHGAMFFASLYLKKPDEAAAWKTLFSNALVSIKRESKLASLTGSTNAVSNGR